MSGLLDALLDIVAVGAPGADRSDLRRALAAQVDGCDARLPGLARPDVETARLWAERASAALAGSSDQGPRALATAIGELRGDDLHLASLCARGDAEALKLFESRFLSGLGAAIARVRPDAAFLDEVKQIVREKLLVAPAGKAPRLVELAGQGDLAGLVRVVGLRTALNLRRDEHGERQTSDDGMLDALASVEHDPVPLTVDRARVRVAFEAALRRLDARDRNVLRMHLLHGLSIDDIGRAHRVHRATAARWLDHVRSRLYQETCDRLGEAGLSDDERASALKLIDSRFEISFERILRPGATVEG